MTDPLVRANDLLRLGGGEDEEARSAAHKAAELAKRHGFVLVPQASLEEPREPETAPPAAPPAAPSPRSWADFVESFVGPVAEVVTGPLPVPTRLRRDGVCRACRRKLPRGSIAVQRTRGVWCLRCGAEKLAEELK